MFKYLVISWVIRTKMKERGGGVGLYIKALIE